MRKISMQCSVGSRFVYFFFFLCFSIFTIVCAISIVQNFYCQYQFKVQWWCCMPLFPALGRRTKQIDRSKIEASLVYRPSTRAARDTLKNPNWGRVERKPVHTKQDPLLICMSVQCCCVLKEHISENSPQQSACHQPLLSSNLECILLLFLLLHITW